MKTQKKNLKPIDIDVHFKYRCPKSDCGCEHWLSLKETKTKNFKIVCHCGLVLKPKKIHNIKISYDKVETKSIPQVETIEEKHLCEPLKIPLDLQEQSVKILTKYGFTHDESIKLTEKAYIKNPVDTVGILVKYIIANLGELDEHN